MGLLLKSGKLVLKDGKIVNKTTGSCPCCYCIDTTCGTFKLPTGGGTPTVGDWYIIGSTCCQVTSITAACSGSDPDWAPSSGPYTSNTCLTDIAKCVHVLRIRDGATYDYQLPAGSVLPSVGKYYVSNGECIKVVSITDGSCASAPFGNWNFSEGPANSNICCTNPYAFNGDGTSLEWCCWDAMVAATAVITGSYSGNVADSAPCGNGQLCTDYFGSPSFSLPFLTTGSESFGGGHPNNPFYQFNDPAPYPTFSLKLFYAAAADTFTFGPPWTCANLVIPADSWYFKMDVVYQQPGCDHLQYFTAYGNAAVSCVDGDLTASGTVSCYRKDTFAQCGISLSLSIT